MSSFVLHSDVWKTTSKDFKLLLELFWKCLVTRLYILNWKGRWDSRWILAWKEKGESWCKRSDRQWLKSSHLLFFNFIVSSCRATEKVLSYAQPFSKEISTVPSQELTSRNWVILGNQLPLSDPITNVCRDLLLRLIRLNAVNVFNFLVEMPLSFKILKLQASFYCASYWCGASLCATRMFYWSHCCLVRDELPAQVFLLMTKEKKF